MSEATITPVDIESLSEEYLAAWEALDPDRIIALHSEDTRFQVHAGTTQYAEGSEDVRQAFADLFEQWPGFGFETQRLLLADSHWVLDWTLTADGGVRLGCLDVVEVCSEGRVARKDTYVDVADLNALLERL